MPSIASYKINEWHERKNYKTGRRTRIKDATARHKPAQGDKPKIATEKERERESDLEADRETDNLSRIRMRARNVRDVCVWLAE